MARTALVAVFLAAGVVAGFGVGRTLDRWGEAAPPLEPPPPAPAELRNLQDSFRAAARFAMKSVVHITTQTNAPADFLGAQENVGSGVIVSAEGHILTNNHVVEAARMLRVRFVDGREFAATVVGRDSETDLALLKIDSRDGRLEPATFANSDEAEVGDWCLAIGSPFGYNHSVTAGIISAKHRRPELMLPWQEFLQTDAAINPGNSGGALVNIRGEVLGVNTAIVTETRGNDGVGLAISSNLARWVMERLKKDGRVRRGFLGVTPLDFNLQLVGALKQDGIRTVQDLLDEVGLKEPRGAFIYGVEPASPAGKAGLRRGDVMVEFNGKPVTGRNDMFAKVAEVTPGTAARLRILRDRKEMEFSVELIERQPQSFLRRR